MYFSLNNCSFGPTATRLCLLGLCVLLGTLEPRAAMAIDCEVVSDTSPMGIVQPIQAVNTTAQTTVTAGATVSTDATQKVSLVAQVGENVRKTIQDDVTDPWDKAIQEIVKELDKLREKAIANGNANMLADNARYVAQGQHDAEHQVRATQPDTSRGCANGVRAQMNNSLTDMNNTAKTTGMQVALKTGTFQNAAAGAGGSNVPTPADIHSDCASAGGNAYTFLDTSAAPSLVFSKHGCNPQAGTSSQ